MCVVFYYSDAFSFFSFLCYHFSLQDEEFTTHRFFPQKLMHRNLAPGSCPLDLGDCGRCGRV